MMLLLCMKTTACPQGGAERSYRGWVEFLRESMMSTFTGNTTRLQGTFVKYDFCED